MITVALLADIHGNLPALEAVLDDLQVHDVQHLLWLGDYADKGPFPEETLQRLQEVGGVFIQGNTDQQIVEWAQAPSSRKVPHDIRYATIRWAATRLNTATLRFLKQLPARHTVQFPGTSPLHIVHRSPDADQTGPLPQPDRTLLATMFETLPTSTLVCAHTHQPWMWHEGEFSACNPGSVGQPCHGEPTAHYAVLTWTGTGWHGALHRVRYNVDATLFAYQQRAYRQEVGLLGYACLLTVKTGQDVFMDVLTHARRIAARYGLKRHEIFPDAIWREAEQTYPWDSAHDGILRHL